MYLAFITIMTIVAIVWTIICGFCFVVALAWEDGATILKRAICLSLSFCTMIILGCAAATGWTVDTQRGLICWEKHGTWMMSKCYRHGKEVDIEEGGD